MRWEYRERFPRHRLQRKPVVSDPGMHHGTCITHVPGYMPELLTRGGGENIPGIPGTCTARNFTYLVGPRRNYVEIAHIGLCFRCTSTDTSISLLHYIVAEWASLSTNQLFVQQLLRANNKTSKLHVHGRLWGESTSGRLIPLIAWYNPSDNVQGPDSI